MIVSAAVKFILDDYEGTTVCIPVHRHKDYLTICEQLLGYEPVCVVEGFLSDKGLFLDRREALDEAIRSGQISADDPQGYDVILSGKLMSEDLW